MKVISSPDKEIFFLIRPLISGAFNPSPNLMEDVMIRASSHRLLVRN